jgi:hypothetical protein
VPFNSFTPADSFFAAGTKTIAAPAGVYTLKAYAVSAIGTTSLVGAITTVTVTSSVIQVDPSESPSTPTVSSVLGAIQLSWNGKTATNTDQPSGFKAAKVYVGTTAGFTPIDTGTVGANQVDVLNFGNGQNTLNIGLGTLVNGVALDHGIDYYIKIKTTNGNVLQDSTAVAATGNPVRVGQVQNGSLVTITADKISTGTLSSGSTITVGATSGKHIKLSGTGDPFTIYGSGGTSNPVLTFNGTKLSIVGDGTFTGNISGATGTLTNSLTVGTLYTDTTVSPNVQRYPFSVSGTGVMNAVSGTIAGWSLDGTSLQSTVSGTIKIDSGSAAIGATPARSAIISIGATSDNHIRITPSGIGTYNSNGTPNINPGFSLASTGVLTLSGGIVSGGSINATDITGSSITGGTIQTSASSNTRRIVIDSDSPNRISFYPKSGDDSTIAGYIEIGDDTGVATLPGFKVRAPSGTTIVNGQTVFWPEASISATANSGGGLMNLRSALITLHGITAFKSWSYMDASFSAGTAIFRNIGFDTAAPVSSDGRTGEVWIQY